MAQHAQTQLHLALPAKPLVADHPCLALEPAECALGNMVNKMFSVYNTVADSAGCKRVRLVGRLLRAAFNSGVPQRPQLNLCGATCSKLDIVDCCATHLIGVRE